MGSRCTDKLKSSWMEFCLGKRSGVLCAANKRQHPLYDPANAESRKEHPLIPQITQSKTQTQETAYGLLLVESAKSVESVDRVVSS